MFSRGWSNSRCCENGLNEIELTLYLVKLKKLSEVLKRKGKYFKVIIPPSKEEVYSERLPSKYSVENPTNDYHLYTSGLKQANIEHWDLLDFYKSIMDTSTYPVYSKTSVHWTNYGAQFTVLKLLDDMNAFFDKRLVSLAVKKINVSKFKNGDGDHELTLNLFSRIDTADFGYHFYDWKEPEKDLFKPKVLTIGDSYYWAMKGCYMLPFVYNDDSKYLFYYNTSYPTGKGHSQPVKT